jgi:hypothetical protein
MRSAVTGILPVLALLFLSIAAGSTRGATTTQPATVSAINLVSTTRTGRTTFDYTYTISVQNGAAPLYSATATVTSSSPDTVIVHGTVNIGNLAANASTTTAGTFTVQQNRLVPFNPGSLSWTFTSKPFSTGPDPLPILNTTTYNATIVLPLGSTVNPGQLAVLDTIAQTVPVVSGQFSIPAYDNGSQIAVVLSPAGNPMLLGWLDANHQTVSAATTAEVFGYFALGGYLLLNDSDRAEFVSEMPQAPGFATLVQAISTAVAASPDAFASSNAAVTGALATFVSGIYAAAATGSTAAQSHLLSLVRRNSLIKPQDVNVATPEQSGISVVADPPYSAHLSNATRRRAWAFVQRVSYTANGQVTPSPAAVTDFEVPPEVGLNGGINGAITDIINAYFGNSNSAYTAVDAPSTGPFPIPVVANSDLTTYQVTVVGPGNYQLGALAALPQNQINQQIQISIGGFTIDAMVPFFSNIAFGTTFLSSSAAAPFLKALATNLQGDLLANTTLLPNLQAEVTAGRYGDALLDILNGITTGNGVLGLLEKDVQLAVAAVGTNGGFGPNGPSGLTAAMTNITKILGTVNAALQVFDTAVYATQIYNADMVDQYTVTSSPAAVITNPATATVGQGGIQPITILSVGGGTPPNGYSYFWSTTSNFGDLSYQNPSTGLQTHQTSFCTTATQVQFVVEQTVAGGTQDTVSVQVYAGPSCASGNGALLGTGHTVLTYDASGCYGKAESIATAGSTYSVTLNDITPNGTIQGTIQRNGMWKGSVNFKDPPYTSTAYESDETTVSTYQPGSASNGTTTVATFGSATEDASYVIYGSAETTTSSSGTTSGSTVLTPPLPFGQLIAQLAVGGPAINLVYAGNATIAGTQTPFSYTESWQLVDTPLVTTANGTFKTCEYQVVTSISPHSLDTKYKLFGYGFEVKETTSDTTSGTPVLEDTQLATAVSINGVPYYGP